MNRGRWIALALLVWAGAQLGFLGVRRAVTGSLDLAAPYAGAAALATGQNPYDPAVLGGLLRGANREPDADPPFTPSLYPPATFVALMPLTLFDWPAARLVWLGVNVILLGLAARALTEMAGVQGTDRVILAGGVLALAPWATGIALGQPAVASVALLIITISLMQGNATVPAGIILAIALLFKPQLIGLFVLYWLVRGPRRPPLIAASVYVALTIAALAVLEMRNVEWLGAWKANSTAELDGGYIDPLGPFSAQMVDARPLVSALLGVRAPMWTGFAIAAVGVMALFLALRKRHVTNPLLPLSCVAVLTLLAGYHRFYDAALLALPIAWALSEVSVDTLRKAAITVCLLAAPFAVSGAWTLQRLGNEGRLGVVDPGAFLWNAVVLRHQTLALMTLAVVLLLTLKRTAVGSAGASPRQHLQDAGNAIEQRDRG